MTSGMNSCPPSIWATWSVPSMWATTASLGPETATIAPVVRASWTAAGRTASTSSVESTPRPPRPTPARAAISEALPRIAVGRSAAARRMREVRKSTAPTLTGSRTQGLPAAAATSMAASAASSWWFEAVPKLMSTPLAMPANCPASASWSSIAGEAPTARSTFALNCCTTVFVMHWMSGCPARSRALAERRSKSTMTIPSLVWPRSGSMGVLSASALPVAADRHEAPHVIGFDCISPTGTGRVRTWRPVRYPRPTYLWPRRLSASTTTAVSRTSAVMICCASELKPMR